MSKLILVFHKLLVEFTLFLVYLLWYMFLSFMKGRSLCLLTIKIYILLFKTESSLKKVSKTVLLKPLSLWPLAKKSNPANFKLTNLLIILHVPIRRNVLTITHVPVVLILNPLNTIAETNLLVPAMAVPNITIAALTSLNILPI